MQNLIIRRTEPKDAEGLHKLYSDKSVYSQTLQLPFSTLTAWENGLNNLPSNIYSFIAINDDEIVGNLGLTHNDNSRLRHSAEVGIIVKEGLQGKGIGTALLSKAIDFAENWLNISRIELTVFTDNKPAMALYQKFGFAIEGEAKNFAFRNGEFVNAYYMARVKD